MTRDEVAAIRAIRETLKAVLPPQTDVERIGLTVARHIVADLSKWGFVITLKDDP